MWNNSSDSAYQLASHILVVYIEPSVCIIGFILNCICLGVFIRVVRNGGYFRKISFIEYLIALCFFDALLLALSIVVIVLPTIEVDLRESDTVIGRQLRALNCYSVRIGYPLLMTANYSIIWIIALICAQRYQAVSPPTAYYRRRFHMLRYSKASIAIVVIVALTLNVARFWELECRDVIINGTKTTEVHDSQLRASIVYKIVQEGVLYGVIVYMLPIAMLIYLNANILLAICQQSNETIANSNRSSINGAGAGECTQKNERRNALMSMTIFALFIVCNTLSIVVRLLMIFGGGGGTHRYRLWFVEDLSNLLVNCNAFLHPLVYFLYTRRFRDLFFEVATGGGCSDIYPE